MQSINNVSTNAGIFTQDVEVLERVDI